jgi:hypothetical protein
MGTYVVIPLKNIDVQQLNELADRFKRLNESLLAGNR